MRLAQYIRDRNIRCAVMGKDRYKRYLAICLLDQTNLNALMVADGFALAYRQYSKAYLAQELQAKDRRKGLW